jgi:hypothetical protein
MAQGALTRPNSRPVFNGTTLWTIGTVTLIASIVIVAFSKTFADPDLWGHLRFGLDTLQAGAVIQVDPYSYLSAGQRWINHEWLAEVIFALAWTGAGTAGLVILRMAVGFLTLGILFRHLLSVQIRPFQAAILLLVMGALPLMPALSLVRPMLFTFLFFALTLAIIWQADAGRYRWLWVVPVLFALWANLHGGLLAGLGLLCLWTALHLLLHRQVWRRILPPAIASVAATLVNPYGIDLMTFLLRTATVQRPEITEWQPLALASTLGLTYVVVLAISCVGLVFSTERRRPLILVLFGITALLPWMSVRHLPLFYIAALVFVGDHVASAWGRAMPAKSSDRPVPMWFGSLLIAVAALLLIAVATQNPQRIVIAGDYPVGPIALLKQSDVAGHLSVPFAWGEYSIWHLGPQIKVSMDGRRETIYANDVYRQYLNFEYGVNEWDALLAQHWTDVALVKSGSPPYNLLRLKPDWLLVFEDATGALFVQRESPLAELLMRTAAGFVSPATTGSFP